MTNTHQPKDHPKNLGFKTNVEVLERFVSLASKALADIGCGGLTFTQILAERCASVIAIDPDPVQAELNRAALPLGNIAFTESSAEHIPCEDNSIDGVFFAYSLHHIPESIYDQVFDEVFRVLRPNGFLYVIEPIEGAYNEVMKLFHDEDVEREAAQVALREIAMPRFKSSYEVIYHGFTTYESFEDYATKFSGRSFNSIYTEEDVRRPEVAEAFERHGAPEYRFESPKKVSYFQDLLS